MYINKCAFSLISLMLIGSASTLYGQGPNASQLTSASQLAMPYNQLQIASAAHPVGSISPGPTISFFGSDMLTFSRSSGQFEVDEADVTYGGSSFSSGTSLVGAGGFQGAGSGGPVTLTFATPVFEFGLNIEDFAGGNYTVDFTPICTVLGKQVSCGTYTASGDDPQNGGQGFLSFEGVATSGEAITSVVFDDSAAGGTNNLMFGNIDYSTTAPASQTPPSVTPEPSSLGMFGTGLLCLAGVVRRTVLRRHTA